MRILFAHSFYRVPGGEDSYVRQLVKLVARSHEVELVAESNTGLEHGPGTALRMLYSGSKEAEIEGAIGRFAPDIVHVHNVYPSLGPSVHMAARKRAVPLVMTVHNQRLRCPNGLAFTQGAICRRCVAGGYLNAVTHHCFPSGQQAAAYASVLWIHRYVLRLEELVALFIVPSEFMRLRLLEWGIHEDRIRVIRHFVNPSGAEETAPEAASYGVFAGRLSSEKGLDVLLRALQWAGDPPFLIVGDGPARAMLQRLATTLNLVNTRFLGMLPHREVGGILAASRYVVVPSISEETANLTALEGLVAARPLLVSELGALPELVAGGAGRTAAPGDDRAWAERIEEFGHDHDLCRRASSAAAAFAREWLTPELHLDGLEAAYREVLGRPGPS